MKVAFYTLGCKVNQYETNGMIQAFKSKGYDIVNFDDKADIYIVNTCTVTNIADRKSRQILSRARKENKDAIIVACGCYAQISKEKLDLDKEIDLVVGNTEKKEIVKYVEDYIDSKSQIKNIDDVLHDKTYIEFGDVVYTEKTRAMIKVQDGCDRFCTYCLIPFARGKIRSRDPKNVISEIKKISQNGIKEVVITGIHVASYGKDFKENYSLIDLLEEINKIDGIERIRLGSIEPLLMSEEFMTRLSKLNKICHHFHLSLQSGSNSTLMRMGRRYTTEEFKEIVDRIRHYYDDSILTTDIIVGFPGETDKEFDETYKFLSDIKFYKMHIFKYSKREGTKAAVMPNQIDGNIKEIRSKKLIELSNKYESEYLESYIGKELEVLFEEKDGEYYKGHTSNYLLVKYKSNENLENKIIKLRLKEENL